VEQSIKEFYNQFEKCRHKMKVRKRPFTDGLSYTLTKNNLLVTLVVGLFLSCVQIGVDFVREQDAVEQFASEIIAAN
jgi:hypothetical protein